MTLTATEKAHEKRVRRMAERQGLKLRRSRSRDPLALDFGLYALAFGGWDMCAELDDDGRIVAPLGEIERWLCAGHGREQVQERERELARRAVRRGKPVTVAHSVAGRPGQTRSDGPGSDPRRDP